MSALAIRSNPYGQMQDLQLAVIRLQEGMNGLSASTNLDQLKQITDLYNTHCIKLALLEQQIDNNSDIFINVSNRLCNIEDQIHLRKLSQKVSALQLEINGIPGSINSDQLKRITDLYNEYLGKLTPFQNHISDNTINIYNNIEDNLTTIEGQIRPFHTSIAKPGFFSSIPTSLKTAFVVGAAYWWFCDPSLLKVAAVAGITGIATHKLTNKPEELPPSSIPSADPVSAHDSHSSVGPLPTLTTAHGSLVSSSYDDLRHGQIARAAAYSASSSSSSSSTPMSTKYPIQVVHSYTGGNRWIQFFLGTGRDDFGRTLQDILTKDDIWLEARHNYIQGLYLKWEKLRINNTITTEIQIGIAHL